MQFDISKITRYRLCKMVILMMFNWNFLTLGIPDEKFCKDNSPITKEEIRVLALSKLRLKDDSSILDIGAGTGSISIEAALIAKKGIVYSIEMENDRVGNIEKNVNSFGIKNMKIIHGLAPEILSNVPKVDRVLIGGSGGKLDEIFDWLRLNLKQEGRIVILAITLETFFQSINLIRQGGYKDMEVCHVFISKGKNIGELTMMEGRNPVYIVSATRGIK